MDSDERSLDLDPDYECNNSAIRRAELQESEDKNELSQISKIIEEVFDSDLSTRQKQIERIEEQLYKAQKLLHAVRYVLISSYYNNQALEYKDEEPSTSDVNSLFETQNRIHPAIKKLLGKNANHLQILNPGSKRKVHNKTEDSAVLEAPSKKIKKEIVDELLDNAPVHKDLTKVKPANQKLSEETSMGSTTVKNRKKSKHIIIVGNISHWKPSPEHNLTHKWMVYVRGPKEQPDVSHIIDRVVFHLHPSYKPDDVVEVSKPPFHLARPGWGEFPIRVKICFKNPFDKPVDIIHNLKLEKTYIGRQTLGNETIVEIFLHDENSLATESWERPNPTLASPKQDNLTIKAEEIDIEYNELPVVKTEVQSSAEHDYCFEEFGAPQEETVQADHCYSMSFADERDMPGCSTGPSQSYKAPAQDVNNSLIYGLDESYGSAVDAKVPQGATPKTLTTSKGQSICFLPQSFNKIVLSNGNIVRFQIKSGQTVLKKSITSNLASFTSESAAIDVDKYKLVVPHNRFKNMGEILPYLFRKLPLYHNLAQDASYKCTYPFTASSFEQYSSWYLAKRLSSEWSRAKAIKRILRAENFFESQTWNTKAILMYGRSHFFTPQDTSTFSLFRRASKERQLLSTCFENADPNVRPVDQTILNVDSDVTIDVVQTDDDAAGSSTKSRLNVKQKIDITDKSLRPQCTFIRQTALDCGIVLKPEEVVDGVTFNGAERMLYEAVKGFASNLIRRAGNHLVCSGHYEPGTSQIGTAEVQIALRERPEMATISKFQKKKRDIDYFL